MNWTKDCTFPKEAERTAVCIVRKMSMYLATVRGKLTKEFPGIFITVLELQAMNLKYLSRSFLCGLERKAYTKAHILSCN